MPFLLVLLLGTAFGAALSDTFKNLFKQSFEAIGTWIYNKFAGTRLFKNIALKKYRQALIEKYQKLKISFRPDRPLEMRKVYVPLKVAGTNDSSLIETDAVQQYPRLMIKGAPGSGKSMLLKYLAFSYADSYAKRRSRNLSDLPVPILLELNRLNDPNLTVEKLQQLLEDAFERNNFPKAKRFVSRSLNNGDLMLLLDGLDEVTSNVRSNVIECLRNLLERYKKCRAIITCRTAVYNNEFFDVVDQTLEIDEFRDQQIRRFLQAWKSEMPQGKSVDQLIQTLRDRPKIMALARNPLLLTIIAYLYSDTAFVLPYSRAEFYTKATNVLLELRDEERNIANKYTGVKKRLVLQALALFAQDNTNREQKDRRSLSVQEVLEQVQQVLPSLNVNSEEASSIVNEIVERSGILLSIDDGQRYQFGHLTLQEYFVATTLIEKQKELIQRWQDAPDDWREIVKLWCGLANDSTALIQAVYQRDPVTAFECLADAQNIKPELADTIIENCQMTLGTVSGDKKETIEKAFGAVASDIRPRGQDVFNFLEATLTNSGETSERTVAANALSFTNLPDAAQTLARYYSSQPEVRQALIRMGDLAVPSLEDLATQGVVDAFDDLMEIKTPEAAKVLLPLLWNDDTHLAHLAAWRLAVLLPLPNVEDTLRKESLPEKNKQNNSLQWIWEPFREEETNNSNLPFIASMIAAKLIEQSSIDSAPAATDVQLDPRIVIPLCTVELRSEARFSRFAEEMASEARYSRFSERMTSDAEFSARFFESAEISSLWQCLFDSLQPDLKFELLPRLWKPYTSRGYPSRDDWRNIFRRVEYEFSSGWHYKAVLMIFAIISLVALTQMGLLVLSLSPLISWTNGLIVAAALAVILGWVFLLTDIYHHVSWDEPDDFLAVLVGTIRVSRFIIEEIFENFDFFANFDFIESLVYFTYFVWSPIIVYFASIFLLTFLSWQFVVLVWLILLVFCGLLWWRGYKLDRDARNPLQGIIKSKESETLQLRNY